MTKAGIIARSKAIFMSPESKSTPPKSVQLADAHQHRCGALLGRGTDLLEQEKKQHALRRSKFKYAHA